LESPTGFSLNSQIFQGSGKTLSLLCASLSWQKSFEINLQKEKKGKHTILLN
jgi:Rad3-related DNA helicase